MRLAAPSASFPMIAGETAELEWGPLALVLDRPGVKEWEAFLSLDDGESYPIRITPHLDRDLRRVYWRVPELPSRMARLLLRFGDEVKETSIEIPHRFVILPSPGGAARIALRHGLARKVDRPGESARPGDPGVVLWVEGSRRGGDLVRVRCVLPEARERLHGPFAHQAFEPAVEMVPEPNAKMRCAAAARACAFLPTPPRTLPAEPVRAAFVPLSPLLQTLRSNR